MMTSSKNCKTFPDYDAINKKQNPKLSIFNYKMFQVFGGFEQLFCSISWRVMTFAKYGQVQHKICGILFKNQKCGFSTIILATQTLKS